MPPFIGCSAYDNLRSPAFCLDEYFSLFLFVISFVFINFAITKGSRQRRCQQPDLCLRSTVWWHRLMLLAFYYFKMMFTDYLLILVLIFDFTFFCSKFYVLINRFYFAINFFSIGKNVYYLRVQFVCIYLQRVLSHNGQYLQNKYLCSFSHSHITKNILRDLCISVLALFSQIAYIVYL